MKTTPENNSSLYQRAHDSVRRSAQIILAIFAILFVLGTIAAQRVLGQTFTVLHAFKGPTGPTMGIIPTDGSDPFAGVIRDAAGNLYGTTEEGGTYGYGTVYKLDPSGNITLLYSFAGTAADPGGPSTGVVIDSAGNLYGTTAANVYKVDTSTTPPTETVLYSFDTSSGAPFPYGDLVIDSAGNLYGTTSGAGSFGYGTVYKVDPSGNETTLYNFTGGSDGASPYAGLFIDSSGNLYGTATAGGAFGNGVVFKLDTSGNETVLYSFAGGSDGSQPAESPIMDSAGNLYGATFAGGVPSSTTCPGGCGTVYELVNTSGAYTEKVLYAFTGQDGSGPEYDHLVMDASGNLYGTTPYGGANSGGSVFKVNPSTSPPAETVLHSFTFPSCGSDGNTPYAGLSIDSFGNLYGTANACGDYGQGTVFEIAGAGSASQDFSIAAASGSSTSATVSAGGSASYDLSVAPSGGFTGTVAFSCSDTISGSACSVSPASVTLDGTSNSSATVKVTTTAKSFVVPGPPMETPPSGRNLWLLAGLAALLVAVSGSVRRTERCRLRLQRVVLVAVLFGVAAWAACGGSSGSGGATGSGGTPSGNYTLMVTGTSGSSPGSLSHSITLTLNVQ